MSLNPALAFIQQVYRDPLLRSKLEKLKDPGDLQKIVAVGTQAGHDFTAEELRQAFAFDWGMRWCHFASKTEKKPLSSQDEALE
ncbi:MAG: Nif11-like leader peptide family natural product precursor [Desulfobacterales bacterium]|nr:Nif11-like leader peptide family natural product precursor [Desulfobacterales bacterium]MCF8078439.1 Nif11-like leader peptide family natural product precursor [Desulfobacterales bacterium]